MHISVLRCNNALLQRFEVSGKCELKDSVSDGVCLLSQVEPMFARQLLYFAGQTNGHYLRGYELQSQGALPVEEYQRSIQHLQE